MTDSVKQKVVFMNSVYPCLSETFIYDQMMILLEHGYDVEFVSNNRPDLKEVHPRMRHMLDEVQYLSGTSRLSIIRYNASLLIKHPVRYLSSMAKLLVEGRPFIESLGQFVAATIIAHRYEDQPNTHFHVNFTYGAAGAALWLSRLTKFKYTLSLHGSDLLFDNPPLLNEKLAAAAGLVSISRYNIEYMSKNMPFLDNTPKVVIPLGVQSMEAPQRPKGKIDRPLRILNVGRLSIHKAQHLLIEACSNLVKQGYSIECSIVGEGPKREPLEKLIEELDAGEYVTLLGPKYHDEVLQLLSEYDVFALTSITEGMPVAIMEAMRARIPLIAPAISGIPELLDDGKAGLLFESNSVEAVQNALQQLLDDKVDSDALTQHAFDFLSEHFDFTKNSHRLMDNFRQF